MPHLLLLDIDELTLATLKEFIREQGQDAAAFRSPRDATHASHEVHGPREPARPTIELLRPEIPARDPSSVMHTETAASTMESHLPALRARSHLLPTHSRITLIFAGWRLEVASRELWTANGSSVALSSGEFELLFTFAKHSERNLTRHQIIDLMRGEGRLSHPRSVDVYVSRLRQKLESDARRPQIIQTVRNGYKFNAPVTIS